MRVYGSPDKISTLGGCLGRSQPSVDRLHKWCRIWITITKRKLWHNFLLQLRQKTVASHWWDKSFVWEHKHEANIFVTYIYWFIFSFVFFDCWMDEKNHARTGRKCVEKQSHNGNKLKQTGTDRVDQKTEWQIIPVLLRFIFGPFQFIPLHSGLHVFPVYSGYSSPFRSFCWFL